MAVTYKVWLIFYEDIMSKEGRSIFSRSINGCMKFEIVVRLQNTTEHMTLLFL